MSSSRQPSNHPNNSNSASQQNQLQDYEIDESDNLQTATHQTPYPMSEILFNHMGHAYENGMVHQMNTFEDEAEEDLPNEIVAELDARDRMRSHINEEDDSVFSDVVQDAFRKYQNEFSKYWTQTDTTWDNRISDDELIDDEQEELLSQMEECWNYMAYETVPTDGPKNSAEDSDQSHLNPDAVEFKPSWLKASSTPMNADTSVTVTSRPAEGQEKTL